MKAGRRPLAIVGPTASGKTAVAVEVASRCGGEIISMDSRQLYRGMDIGTAKASPEQRAAVPHHGLDLITPAERFSAGRFARYARRTLAEIEARGALPILVGGTGFFLRALTHPIFREPDLEPERTTSMEVGAAFERERGARPVRPDRPERPERPAFAKKERVARPPQDGMQTFRVEVGYDHGVKPGNIVGAVANEANIESRHIGRIEIFEDHSLIDLPEGMPREVLEHLKKVWVSGQQLRMRRADEHGRAPGGRPGPKPGGKPRGKPAAPRGARPAPRGRRD